MAIYMTQPMSSGTFEKVTYYRKQSQTHVTHTESEKFTDDATKHYADSNGIEEDQVEQGNYKSGQGVPTAGLTQKI